VRSRWREISKLTVPVVRDKVFGVKSRPEPDDAQLAPADLDDLRGRGPDGVRAPAGNTTRILIKSRNFIVSELENLSREYTDK
jgi:hypothetical protein